MLYGIIFWCLDAGGVGVGVDATECGASKELRAECDGYMLFIEDSVLFWENDGGGG